MQALKSLSHSGQRIARCSRDIFARPRYTCWRMNDGEPLNMRQAQECEQCWRCGTDRAIAGCQSRPWTKPLSWHAIASVNIGLYGYSGFLFLGRANVYGMLSLETQGGRATVGGPFYLPRNVILFLLNKVMTTPY